MLIMEIRAQSLTDSLKSEVVLVMLIETHVARAHLMEV